jgi:hypothetical protein
MANLLPAASTTRKGLDSSKFMGASFGAGNSLAEKVSNNSRKITLLKNIVKIRKGNVDKKLDGGGMLDVVKGINQNVGGILSILQTDAKIAEDDAADAAKDDEKAGRAKKEKDKEGKAKGLKIPGPLQKAVQPITNIWGAIVKTFMLLLAGWGLDKIFKWFDDPKNKTAIEDLKEFITVAVPAIVKGLLAVIAIGFVAKLALFTKSIIMGSVKLIAGLWAFMGKLKLFAMANPAVAGAIGLGALVGGLAIIGRKGEEKAGSTVGDEGFVANTMGSGLPVPLNPSPDKSSPSGGLNPFESLFAGGGLAQGTDTVPAMLTPGEFVMSKGAVNQWGSDTLEGMNAAGGGTNKPKQMSGGGAVYAKGGGHIDVKGSGDGSSGTMKMFDKEGKQVGKSYNVMSGLTGMGGVSQKQRKDVSGKGYPMPDGDYKVHGFDEHGPLGGKLSGLGNWSSFIGPGSGNIGKRTGLMIHNDVDPFGTLGCIGVGLGGKAGSKQDKEFVKSYKIANPEKIMVKLGGGTGSDSSSVKPSATADNSITASANQLIGSPPGGGTGGGGVAVVAPPPVQGGQGGSSRGDSDGGPALFSPLDGDNLSTLIMKSMYSILE